MTAGFFQAILQFSKMQVGENLEAINMSDSLFYFSTKESFTFIIREEKSSPRTGKEINLMLSQLSQQFLEKFPSAAKWDGDLSYFESFSGICDDILNTKTAPAENILPQEVIPEQELIPISTVIVEEASAKLYALVESGNANESAKKFKKAKEDYDGAIGFLTLMPELVRFYPDLKTNLIDRMKNIEKLLTKEKIELEVKTPPKGDKISSIKPARPAAVEGGILVDLHGASVFQPEADILIVLEQQLGKALQHIVQVVWDSLGFTVAGGHVQQLGLYKQGLTALPPKVSGLPYLQVLSIEDNRITTYPDVIEKLPSLEKLSLASNPLTSIPDSIGKLQNLRILNLGWNKLTSLSKNLPITLEILDLRYNKLSTLPDALGTLTNLQELALDYNQLTAFPSSIGKLHSLQKLTLNNNQLGTLPSSFGQLQSLQKLEMNANKLESLPDSFGDLAALQTLDLGDNLLTELPTNFGNLGALVTLTLIHNRLKILPDSFGSLHSLRDLCLSFNKLTSLPSTMGGISELEILDLRGTPLETLPSCMTQLSSLQTLFLGRDLLRDPVAMQLSKSGVKILEAL